MRFDKMMVREVVHERNYPSEGLSVPRSPVARARTKSMPSWILAVDEDLNTLFAVADVHVPNGDVLRHPYTHISLSDGGAHTRYQVATTWPTYFLAHWVRDEKLMGLEQAHYKISALPAWIAGFRDRGVLREGLAADIIVYDLDRAGLRRRRPRLRQRLSRRRAAADPKGGRLPLHHRERAGHLGRQ